MKRAVLRSFAPRIELREGGVDAAWAAKTNGSNNVLGLWVWADLPSRAAIVSQELFEWRYRLRVGLVAGLAVSAVYGALAALLAPVLLWGTPLAFFLAFAAVPRLHFIQRRKELFSHEVETQAAAQLYDVDPDEYRLADIGTKRTGGMTTYPWLKSMSPPEIERAMKKHSGPAKEWVRRNGGFLRKVRDFRFKETG